MRVRCWFALFLLLIVAGPVAADDPPSNPERPVSNNPEVTISPEWWEAYELKIRVNAEWARIPLAARGKTESEYKWNVQRFKTLRAAAYSLSSRWKDYATKNDALSADWKSLERDIETWKGQCQPPATDAARRQCVRELAQLQSREKALGRKAQALKVVYDKLNTDTDEHNKTSDAWAAGPVTRFNYYVRSVLSNLPGVLSGAGWARKFPGSTSTSALAEPFQGMVNSFIAALRQAGATVHIEQTYRPPDRAHLMHWAWQIARKGHDPTRAEVRAGINIIWAHRTPAGALDRAASKNAAEAMVKAYGIGSTPSLTSKHTKRLGLDMYISWSGTLRIKDGTGTLRTITSTPLTGHGNSDVQRVGASYGVHKYAGSKGHWSDDGG